MKEFITQRMAAAGLIGILSMFVILHSLILLRIVPYEVVWGGRLKNVSEMISFETVAILISLLMLTVAAVAGGYVKTKLNPTVLKVALWLMAAVFILNTFGNLFSTSRFEQMVFAPLTLLLSALCLKLANAKKVN
jgi:hypothetical protein